MLGLDQELYTVKEAFLELKKYGLTKNEQIVRRWIRGEVPGKELKSIAPPVGATKIGYRITKEDLAAFISKHAKEEFLPKRGNKKSNKKGNNKSNEKTAESVEIQRLQKEVERLTKENEALKESNKKSNDKEIERLKKENEMLKNDNKKSNENNNLKRSDIFEQPMSDIAKDKKNAIKKPFNELTEESYDRLCYTLASLWEETNEQKEKIQQLMGEIEHYKLLVGEKRPTQDDRKVLKGIGFSLSDIQKKLPAQKEEVRNIKIEKISSDNIEVTFEFRRERYRAIVVPRLDMPKKEELDSWTIQGMKKVSSNRKVNEKRENEVIHSVVLKTFKCLYELEQAHDTSFYYLSDTDL